MSPRKRALQVFVAYPYKVYRKAAYRSAFRSLSKVYNVAFNFADERFTKMHILDKVITYMRGADLCIFDLSAWNPNVALELGIAYASDIEWFICFNPSKKGTSEVPSDLRGFDRVEYRNFKELTGKLSIILEEKASKKDVKLTEAKVSSRLRNRIRIILGSGKGFRADQLAAALGTTVESVQLVLDPMIRNRQVRYSGETRGRKYYLR